MSIVKITNSDPFSPPDYKAGDERTILPISIKPTFTTKEGRVEAFVYDLQGNLLNYNPDSKYSIIGNNENIAESLELFPTEEVSDLGIDVGVYNVSYNILNNELESSDDSPFSLKQISANRKELRLTTSFSTLEELKENTLKISPEEITSPYYPDFQINFGNNKLAIATNIIFDDTNNQYSILVKLYEPLPSYASEKDACWITTKQRDPITYEVELEAPLALPTPRKNVLKGPNFSLPLNNQIHSAVKLTNLSELQNLVGITTSSKNQLDSLLHEKGAEINIDYTKFDNFIHFSSAEERVKNFYSKVDLIQTASTAITIVSSSGIFSSQSRFGLESEVNNIIQNFDGFEYWMYYTSGGYDSNAYPQPYPKTNSTPPYILATTASAAAISWLATGSLSGSNYDNENTDNLIYTIPDYLLEDSTNEPYKKFVEMVGQHFDTLFTYIKDITNRYDSDNRLDFGISKDLVGDALKSMGINLYTGNFTSYDLVDSLVGTRTPASGSDGQNYSSVGFNYVTASAYVVPVEDVNKEIYKRIYHNLPQLLRQKGSLAGLRTLITCFGIPEEILKIREFDIQGKSTIYNLPEVDSSSSIFFPSESAIFPPERSNYIPSKFLSPLIRVQQNYVKSESYERSLHYAEVGYSPQGYIDENTHSSFEPLGTDFPDFNEFNFGSNINYYSSKFVSSSLDATTQDVQWDLSAFVRYIKFLDSSLFQMVKDFTPVRSMTATGVIIKPTIKERQRQRPAQISKQPFSITNISGSTITDYYDWVNGKYVYRSIGNYDARLKTGSFEYPSTTGGSFTDFNRYKFGSGADWNRYDLITPINSGFSQVWVEETFDILSITQPILGYASSSRVAKYFITHSGQEEFYNGIFHQSGIGNLDNYLMREIPTASSSDGSGVIRTNNNRFNPYKSPVSNKFSGLELSTITSIVQWLNGTKDVYYNTNASVIYIKVNDSINLTEDLLLGNGANLTFETSNGTIVSYTVAGNGVSLFNGAANFVAFFVIDNPTGNDDNLIGEDGNDVIFVSNTNPLTTYGNPLEPWAYSEYNPLTGNSFDPQAGLVNYAGIRKSNFYLDLDYSPSAPSSINPINISSINSQSIFFGTASFAPIPDSNYSSQWWRNSRYDGNRNSSLDFNSVILKAIDEPIILNINTFESLGLDPYLSSSTPQGPQLPQDSPEGSGG